MAARRYRRRREDRRCRASCPTLGFHDAPACAHAPWTLSYSVGNEHNPANPWGRSELVIGPDGFARLDHYFSRKPGSGARTGQVDAAALATLQAALERAGFPDVPEFRPVADATLRHLTVQIGGTRRTALVDWHAAPALPGYGQAFDVLDGVIRQLSGENVPYPSAQPLIVCNIFAI